MEKLGAIFGVGLIAGPIVGGVMSGLLGNTLTFYLLGAFCVAVAVVLVPQLPSDTAVSESTGEVSKKSSEHCEEGLISSYTLILSIPQVS